MPEIVLNKALTFVSLLGTCALLFSISHELGYFIAIDFRLVRLLTIGDYLQGAMAGLPIAVFPLLVGLYWSKGDRIYKEEILDKEPDSLGKRFRAFPIKYGGTINFFMFGILSVILMLFAEPPLSELGLAVTLYFVFIIVGNFLIKSSFTLKFLADAYRPYVYMSSIFIAFNVAIFGHGYLSGSLDVYKFENDQFLFGDQKKEVVLLRSLERGFLFKNIDDNKVSLFSPDQKTLFSSSLKIATRTRACSWLDISCMGKDNHIIAP